MLFVSAVSILVFLIFSIEDLRSYIFDNHLSKIYGDSGSGVVRILNLQHSLDLFLSNPIIGIGYGSHRSTTLVFSLLVNIGILGTMFFLYIFLRFHYLILKD